MKEKIEAVSVADLYDPMENEIFFKGDFCTFGRMSFEEQIELHEWHIQRIRREKQKKEEEEDLLRRLTEAQALDLKNKLENCGTKPQQTNQ